MQPTPRPSKQPTATPTLAPSMSPTRKPTSEPTRSPTKPPSKSPSKSPTHNPTLMPSYQPTYEPTWYPSTSPTFKPSSSGAPSSSQPTEQPTMDPTSSPTKSPSRSPTYIPTHAPSYQPTYAPTWYPTTSPTFRPSVSEVPSPQPSDIPTISASPTVSSSSSPSVSLGPTPQASHSPSVSALPSLVPSVSLAPTKTPISIVPVSVMELILYSSLDLKTISNTNTSFINHEDELRDILNEYLYKEIRAEVSRKYRIWDFDMILLPVGNRRANLRSRELLSNYNYLLSGQLLFIGDLAPESSTTDDIIYKSISEKMDLFDLLQSAENRELHSIIGIEVSLFSTTTTPSQILTAESAISQNPWDTWFNEHRNLAIACVTVATLCLLAGLVALAKRRRREYYSSQLSLDL